jgi:rhamnulokinase
MKTAKQFLAIDLGAESGRVMLGRLESKRLLLEEVARFPNEPVKMLGTLYWDLPRLYREIQNGIALGGKKAGGKVDGIGVDSWGVDFGLLDRSGGLLQNPVHYRDPRTEGVMEEVFRRIPREKIFAETGNQFLALNTLYQLASLKKRSPDLLQAAGKLLLMADLVHYLLTGRVAAELTLASTSQMWNPERQDWSAPILEALGLPRDIFPPVVEPGTPLGKLRDEKAGAGFREAPAVIAPASHDTASAIAAVPATGSRTAGDGQWAYLSSGTWSLLGVELDRPQITKEALERNFTNEGGAAGTTRFLRNINGLWLVQECRGRWAREGEDLDYGKLAALAEEAGSSKSFILPGNPLFFAPEDMPAAIREFCRRTGQAVPGTKGEIVRAALESLALTYRWVAEQATALAGKKIERLHVVGGGSQNLLLNQLTANAMQVPLFAGPVEATAMGNILVQAQATGDVGSIEELREIVRSSTPVLEFTPLGAPEWEEKYSAYRALMDREGMK